MRMPVRQRPAIGRSGVVGTARVDRRTRALLPRLRPGDVAVLDHTDLDRTTAQALVDAGVVAVVNAAPMISGRYPSLGPEVLVAAGITVVDQVGSAGLAAIADGGVVRVDGGTVLVEDRPVAVGRQVDGDTVARELTAARDGLTAHLETFTHNTAEFLRREQDLLLHGLGVPRPATRIAGRPVVVVARGHEHAHELALVRTFLREQHPVLVGVGRGADVLREARLRADVVVVDATADETEIPSAKALKAARDVVVRTDRGAGRSAVEHLERLGIRPLRFESGATPEDAALLLVAAADAALIVGVGLRATLEELLDSQRAGLASTYLTRLKVGQRLVDAAAVPHLYAGRVRPRHLLLVMLSGLIALGAAVGVTPVGQEWADALADLLQGLLP
ncbi:putative cytokinetic ring protein SteA [Nocardioides sp.]|uniref:putative cytokinetic ring protein SteA n=1 Tax=Nocardioides sp. TaxID=35761 RepID=UPI0026203368|nr:putative cytokinetic ring protein SteA [Nocardioides sp.]MDI6912424.1 putative cytokinetic ring protein SteA [Nocardioides sp.]